MPFEKYKDVYNQVLFGRVVRRRKVQNVGTSSNKSGQNANKKSKQKPPKEQMRSTSMKFDGGSRNTRARLTFILSQRIKCWPE